MQNYRLGARLLKRTALRYRIAVWLTVLNACVLVLGMSPRIADAAPQKGTLAFGPTIANFGRQNVGSAAAIYLLITNKGNAPVTIRSESLSGGPFTATQLELPYSLAPGKRISIMATFAPQSAGQFVGFLEFVTDATNGTVFYEMTGVGVELGGGLLTAAPTGVNFGSVPVGTSASQTIQLENSGTTDITISAPAVSSTAFALQTFQKPVTLAPGQTVTCTLLFTPVTSGYVAGSISFISTASNSTLTLTVSGTGIAAVRSLAASPSALSFGNESVGSTLTLPVSLANTGNSNVTVSSISVPNADIQTSGGVGGAIIGPGQTATLNVSFSPKKAENVSGNIVITSNASNSPTTVQVSGTGVSNTPSSSGSGSSNTGGSTTSYSVSLNWQASTSANITGYYVYRITGTSGSYSKLITTPVTGLSYVDSTVAAGQSYTYAVTAVDSSGIESSYSSPVTASIP